MISAPVCGLLNESIQKRLLAEADLSLKRTTELALGMEAAGRNAKSLKGTEIAVQKLTLRTAPSGPCYRCGRANHVPKECKFRDAECHYCKKRGHIATACRARAQPKTSGKRKFDRKGNDFKKARERTRSTRWVGTDHQESEASDVEELQLFTVGERASRPLRADVTIDGTPLTMEIDTGAAVSLISERQQKVMFPNATLDKSRVELKTYTGERITVAGELKVQVRYGQQKRHLPLIIVAGDGPSLLGRNWLEHLRLDWKTVGTISSEPETDASPANLEALLTKQAEIFRDELGTIKPFKAKLRVRQDATPRFFKPPSVPFAIREAIELELDRLEACGILKKVTYSEWAAPIVAVPKKDGKHRICGDYKVSVNQALEVDQYPLAKPEDLFATLAGGKTFTVLDLSQAYQLVLDEDSTKYLTINTHRGLYRYTRLLFGVASALAMFQKLMDTILQGIPYVVCYTWQKCFGGWRSMAFA